MYLCFSKIFYMKKLLSLFIFLLTTNILFANPFDANTYSLIPKKQKTTGFDKRRLLLGPGVGAGAAYRAFSINLSPTVAYAFTENFNAGATFGFSYFQQAEDYTNYVTGAKETFKYKFPGYSFSIFGRYLIKNFLMLNVEPELSNVKFVKAYTVNSITGKIIENKQRVTIPAFLLGVAYMQRFSQYGYSFIGLNYDLVQNPNNVRYYQTLDYRVGIMLQLFQK